MPKLLLAISILWLAWATPAWAADGRILALSGEVLINGEAAEADSEINRQDTIVTGADGTVMIVLADNSVLDLTENSEITLAEYGYFPDEPESNTSEIEIVEGSLRYVSGLISKQDASDISFKAGSSTIGIRGSFVIMTRSGNFITVDVSIGTATYRGPAADATPVSIDVATGNSVTANLDSGESPLVSQSVATDVGNAVSDIAAIANDPALSPEQSRAAIQQRLSGDPAMANDPEALALALVVVSNNGSQLGIEANKLDIVADIVGAASTIQPDSAASFVFIASAVNDTSGTGATNPFVEAVEQSQQALPAEERTSLEDLEGAADTGDQINADTRPNAFAPPPGGGSADSGVLLEDGAAIPLGGAGDESQAEEAELPDGESSQ